MTITLATNQSQDDIDRAKLDNAWIQWVCPALCGFERPVRIGEIKYATACPRCKATI